MMDTARGGHTDVARAKDHLASVCMHSLSAWIGLAPAGCNVIVYAVSNTPGNSSVLAPRHHPRTTVAEVPASLVFLQAHSVEACP